MGNSELLNHFLLFGIILTIGLILILAKKEHRNLPNLIFAILMVNLTIFNSLTLFKNIGWFESYPYLFAIRVPNELLFGPFLYMYFMQLAKRRIDFSLKFFSHLYIPGLSLLLVNPTIGNNPWSFERKKRLTETETLWLKKATQLINRFEPMTKETDELLTSSDLESPLKS